MNFQNRTIFEGNNLQLLCQACNSTKGAGTQAELIAKLKATGVVGMPV